MRVSRSRNASRVMRKLYRTADIRCARAIRGSSNPICIILQLHYGNITRPPKVDYAIGIPGPATSPATSPPPPPLGSAKFRAPLNAPVN
jgi:hypothetical protein